MLLLMIRMNKTKNFLNLHLKYYAALTLKKLINCLSNTIVDSLLTMITFANMRTSSNTKPCTSKLSLIRNHIYDAY